MGLTYATSIGESKILKSGNLLIMDTAPDKIKSLEKIDYFEVYDRIENCIDKADVVLIAIKPYHSSGLFDSIKNLVRQDQLFVSLMAGVTIKTIQDALGVKKVIRTMPNLPAQVGKGVTSFTSAPEVSPDELGVVKKLLDTTGISLLVKDERTIDASTGISGSGPAYVFFFIEALEKAGIDLGLPAETARLLTLQTFFGAAALAIKDQSSPADLRARVTSKGGTTERGILALEEGGVGYSIALAARAAAERAAEMGELLGKDGDGGGA